MGISLSINPLASDLDHILDHTRDLWNNLRGERLFITGGTGFFGGWLLESFLWVNNRLRLGATATILTRSPENFRKKKPRLAVNENITLVPGDIRAFAFPSGKFSHIIHAAADTNAKLNTENPQLMLDTIVDGTRRTLDFAQACDASRFLLTSSGAVYGKQPPGLTHIPEEYPGAPEPLDSKSAYGQGKRMAEHLCALTSLESKNLALSTNPERQTAKLQIKVARCFAFVGPYLPLDEHYAIGNFIRDGLSGGPIIIQGDGSAHRSYLYTADLAIWLWTILFKGQSLRPYNVGSNESLSIAEIGDRVANQFSAKILVEVHGTLDAQKPVERYVPDIHRAENELGLTVLTSLDTSILRTIQFERGKPIYCY
jgi:nucleoside-diphosphate-sugar epimerase